MSDLFGDEGGTISVFAARKAVQQARPTQAPRNAPQQAPKKRRTAPETTLYRSQATITEVGQGAPIGEFTLQIVKQRQTHRIIALSQQNTILATLTCDASIKWQMFENCDCSTRLADKREVLLHFQDEEEQGLFTVISQLGRAAANGGVSFVKDVPSNQFTENLIDMMLVDMSQIPLKVQVSKKGVSPDPNSIAGKIARAKSPGTIAVVKVSDTVMALVEVRANPKILPNVPVEEDEDAFIEEEEQADADLEVIDGLQRELQLKFDEMALMLKGLRPKQFRPGMVTVPNHKLLYMLQCAVSASAEKDERLAELQTKIDRLGDTVVEERERLEMKQHMEHISELLVNEAQAEIDLDSKIMALRKRVRELKETVGMGVDVEEREAQMRREHQEAMRIAREEGEKEMQRHQAKIQEVAQARDTMVERMVKFVDENPNFNVDKEMLKGEEELRLARKEVNGKLKMTLRELVRRVYGLLSENIEDETKYPGEMALTAIKTALQRSANAVVNGSDDDESEEGDEEEED